MDTIKVLLIVISVFLVYAITTKYRKYRLKEARLYRIRADWDELEVEDDRNYILEVEEMYSQMKKYSREVTTNEVDDITWNDFDLDEIYHRLNHTHSTMGELYLYHILRNPVTSPEKLKEREEIIKFFIEHEDLRVEKEYQLSDIGKFNRVSIYKYKEELEKFPTIHTIPHIIIGFIQLSILVLCSFHLYIGIIAFMLFLIINLTFYYQSKKKFEPHLPVVMQLGSMLNTIRKLDDLKGYKELEPYANILNKASKLSRIYRTYYRLMGHLTLGFIPDIDALYSSFLVVYLHLDIILFPKVNRFIRNNMDLIIQIYETVGFLDSMISIGAFRHKMEELEGNTLCRPEFTKKIIYDAKDIYHPLIGVDSVTNTISTEKSVLITGSNATGKSTFLRTVGINAILAQTIHTVFGTSYRAPFFHILSSMNLRDNILNQDSYFMSEVKSLKRILDASWGEVPILCCVDEVLRGTNTTERIAAASKILEKLADSYTLCFVASHDLELTYILEEIYENYHFQEQVTDRGIECDYILYQGRSYTRNAIQILKLLGFSDEIVGEAKRRADCFMDHGKWV